MSLEYDANHAGVDNERVKDMNFHDSLGFILYALKAKIEAKGGAADDVTIGSGPNRATVSFADIDAGFANNDSDWEQKLADTKVAAP